MPTYIFKITRIKGIKSWWGFYKTIADAGIRILPPFGVNTW